MDNQKRYITPDKEFTIIVNDKEVLAWTFDQIDRKFGCAECCTGDRCDEDCKKGNRKNCEHCKGTGWINEKDVDGIRVKNLKSYYGKSKNRRFSICISQSPLRDPHITVSTKRLIDFKSRNIATSETVFSVETFVLLKDLMQYVLNDKAILTLFKDEIQAMHKQVKVNIKFDPDFQPELLCNNNGTSQPGIQTSNE